MKFKLFIKSVITGLFLLCSQFLSAQVLVEAEANKSRIVLGEQFRLKITVSSPSSDIPFVNSDSIPHFEKLDSTSIDTIRNSEGITMIQELTLTSFDSGHWSIPPFAVAIGDRLYTSDSIPMDVTYSEAGIPEEYHDIQDIADVKSEYNWMLWVVIALLLLGLILFFLWWRKRKKEKAGFKRYEHLSPLDEALKLLEELEAEKLEPKVRYTRLSYILRIFLQRKRNMNAFRKTTYELLLKLEKSSLDQDQYVKLAQTLRACNLVKFAKYEPTPEEDREHINVIRTSIQRLNSEA